MHTSSEPHYPSPVTDFSNGQFSESDTFFALANRGAQDLRYFPSVSDGITEQLYDDFSGLYYAQLGKHNKPEADYLIARSVRDVAWGAMMHVVYTRLMRNQLQQLGHEQLPAAPANAELDGKFYEIDDPATRALIDNLTVGQEKFMHAGMGWLLGAAQATITEIESEPSHAYRPLWSQVEHTEKRLQEVQLIRDERKRESTPTFEPVKPRGPENIEDAIVSGMVDNLSAVRKILIRRQQARTQRHPHTTSAELERLVLPDIERLGDLASVNSLTAQHILNSRDIGLVEEGPLADPTCKFTRKSLQNGPWKTRQFCPGQYQLQSPYLDDRLVAHTYFQKAGIRIPDGTFNTVAAILILGAGIATETLWAENVSQ